MVSPSTYSAEVSTGAIFSAMGVTETIVTQARVLDMFMPLCLGPPLNVNVNVILGPLFTRRVQGVVKLGLFKKYSIIGESSSLAARVQSTTSNSASGLDESVVRIS